MTASIPWLQAKPLKLSGKIQDILKIIALVTMAMDHFNRSYMRLHSGMNDYLLLLGRLSFPIFCLLIAYNLVENKVDPKKYIVPLLISGIVSQIPYIQAIAPTFNIMFTLLLGIAAYWVLETNKAKHSVFTTPIALFMIFLLNGVTDYQFGGAFLIPIAAYAQRQKTQLGWVFFVLYSIFINNLRFEAVLIAVVPSFVMALSAFEGKRFLNKYIAYAFYPIHLWVLVMLTR
jgi:hypothetical protein